MRLKEQIKKQIESKVEYIVGNNLRNEVLISEKDRDAIERKKALCQNRSAEIVKCRANSRILSKQLGENDTTELLYRVHYQYLIKQGDHLYLEEQCEERNAVFKDSELMDDNEIVNFDVQSTEAFSREIDEEFNRAYQYDRLAAVRYAERWWNSYNPKYKKFEVDCTNYISQCIHEGGVPMTGYPNRSKGWWMRNNNWSYSWSVAHSFRWYLSGSTSGLRAKEVSSAEELLLGDVICYDFEGDGRFNHTTIVVAKDAEGMPLVNAHTSNSRMRYWAYEDSTAYTPNIKYKFFSILDNG